MNALPGHPLSWDHGMAQDLSSQPFFGFSSAAHGSPVPSQLCCPCHPTSLPSSVIAIAEHCPAALSREGWSLGAFEIRAKMYSGHISSVYRAVRPRHRGGGRRPAACPLSADAGLQGARGRTRVAWRFQLYAAPLLPPCNDARRARLHPLFPPARPPTPPRSTAPAASPWG